MSLSGEINMNVPAVLEGASKAAAGVGIVLAMSYVSGLFKMVGFYGDFHADWLFDMLDVQGFISEGLPITSLSLIMFATHLFGMGRINHKHKGWILFALTIIILLVGLSIPVFFNPNVSRYMIAALAAGLVGAGFAAWIAHGHIYPSRSTSDMYHMFFALFLMLGLGPYFTGKARTDDIQNAREETTEIIDSKNQVIGVLVRVVSGKYLVLDCNVRGQLSFYEITSSLKLRRSSGQCRSTF